MSAGHGTIFRMAKRGFASVVTHGSMLVIVDNRGFCSMAMVLSVVLFLFSTLFAATFTVSKDGRGRFSSVQKAIYAAKAGDEVVILDFGTCKEQATIDGTKNRLTLRSEKPRLRQPINCLNIEGISSPRRKPGSRMDKCVTTFLYRIPASAGMTPTYMGQ